jgi:phage terminase large subunit-like protein
VSRDYIQLAADYQAGVISGSIPACSWVKLACERNRKDLDRQSSEGFPYIFSPSHGRAICQMAEMLPHVKGPKAYVIGKDDQERPIWNPIVLEGWQCWILTTLFGWVHAQTGLRRFRTALILIPRKNAKSTLGAIIALYMLTADGESGAEVYSAATTRDQSKVVGEIAWEMARRSPGFRDYFGVRVGAKTTRVLEVPGTASKFMPLSADAHSLDGLNVSCAIIDELHAHRTSGVYDVIDTATGARSQPLLAAITTAGVEFGGICHQKLGYLHKVLDGVAQDETFFGIEFTIDAQSHKDKIYGLNALLEIDHICTCGLVKTTAIERLWREICARSATTNGGESMAQSDVTGIQIDSAEHLECATPVISNTDQNQTHPSKIDLPNTGVNGPKETRTENSSLAQNIGHGQRTEKNSISINYLALTESRDRNTNLSLDPKMVDVPYVISSHGNYTSIIAIARESFGDCSARNATAGLAFSEILASVYRGHSVTCKARTDARLLSNGFIELDRPPDDIKDPAIARKSNPNYGVSVDPDDLQRKINEAQHSQAALNNILTKHFNVWIRTESGWMTGTVWQTCTAALTWDQLKDYPCWIGVDLGEVRDFSALVLLFKTGPESFAVIPFIYVPDNAIIASPITQLSGFKHQGHLIVTPGDEADYQRIEDDLMLWWSRLQVKEIDFDRRSARLMMQKLRKRLEPSLGKDKADQVVLDIPQGLETMDPAMKMAERLVYAKNLQHDGNECMAWMVSNVVIERNHKDEIFPRKAGGKDSHNKIDGPVAFFTCLSQAMQSKDEQEPQMFFVGGRR